MNRKLLFPVVVLVVSSIACSTFTRSTPENTVNVESTPTIETTIPQTEVVEAPTAVPTIDLNSITSAEDLPPLTFGEVLDARVESGEWTEGEGLLHIMKIFTGELSLQDDSELQSVFDVDATGIILRLQQYLSSPESDPQIAVELERMLNNLLPSKEMLDAISTPRAHSNSLKVASPKSITNNQAVLCENLRSSGIDNLIQGDVICFEYLDSEDLNNVRIYYPNTFVDNAEYMQLVKDTQAAVVRSLLTYGSFDAGPPLFRNGPTYYVVNIQYPGSGLKQGMAGLDKNQDCSITVFPEMASYYDTVEKYQQFIAAGVYTCIAKIEFKDPTKDDLWWFLGSAEYFSNLVYSSANKEHAHNLFFDLKSLDTSLYEMGKENFAFFQFLGNQVFPLGVVNSLHGLAAGKDLSEFVSDQMFNSFVVDYLSSGIPDSDGETYIKAIVPIEQLSSQFKATISKESNFFLSSPPFTATRYLVDYEKEKRFLQSEEGSVSAVQGVYSAVEADLYQNRAAWSAPPEEIRSFCEKNKKYLYVSTTTSGKQFNPAFKITKVDEASCDPCLLGVWKVDNDSFTNYMMDLFVKNGVDFTQSFQGAGEIYMYITGDYFLGFKEGGEMGTWRNNFTISVGVPNVTTFDTVIQSAGLGNYAADGKILTIKDLTDKVISSKVYMGDSELPDSGSSDASDFYLFRPSYSADVSNYEEESSGGNREYKCDNESLVLTHESESDLVFFRADELIPTPMPTESNP